MPRGARIVMPELALHIVQRGNNRGRCFFRDDDYAAYLGLLRFCARHFECSVHAYCLMTNHVHLLLTPHHSDACALFMKALSQSYVQYVNKAMKRTGTLWEGRFKSCLVGSPDYVFACYRYIEMNPVCAGLAAHPGDYRWSSYGANADGRSISLLDPHPAYLDLAAGHDQRLDAYRQLFGTPLETTVVDEIRKATRGGYLVGARRRGRGRPAKGK